MTRTAFTLALCLLASFPAQAQGVFAGRWTVTKAEDAPWVGPHSDLKPDYDAALSNAVFTFGPKRVDGPGWFACPKPHYAITELEPESLFEGGLSDPDHGMTTPKQTAEKLGFVGEKFPTLETGCAELSFHLAAPDTILFGLNNVIYTLKRTDPGIKRQLTKLPLTSASVRAAWAGRLRVGTPVRPGNDKKTKRDNGAKFSPEKHQNVGGHAERWCTGKCISQCGQGEHNRADRADKRYLDLSDAYKDKRADCQSTEGHHDHRAVGGKAEELDRPGSADVESKFDFICLRSRDRIDADGVADDSLPTRNKDGQRRVRSCLKARQGNFGLITIQRIVMDAAVVEVERESFLRPWLI
jgi:hypothetical protein